MTEEKREDFSVRDVLLGTDDPGSLILLGKTTLAWLYQ